MTDTKTPPQRTNPYAAAFGMIGIGIAMIVALPTLGSHDAQRSAPSLESMNAEAHLTAVMEAPAPRRSKATRDALIARSLDASAIASGGDGLCPGGWTAPFNDPGLEGQTIYALAEYDGDLYAGGTFTTAGSETVNHIARWDGENWHAVGDGVNGVIRAMHVHDGSLYTGGHFTSAGGTTANRIARWDGENWLAVGDGFNNTVFALTEHDGEVIAGGSFTHSGTTEVNRVARWNASVNAWQPLGEGMNRSVLALSSTDLGLVAGGHFTTADNLSVGRVALWTNNEWIRFGGGFIGPVHALQPVNGLPAVGGAIQSKLTYFGDPKFDEDPEDPNLGNPVDRTLVWTDFGWSSFTGVLPPTPNHSVNALTPYNDAIHAAGKFTDVSSGGSSPPAPANLIARWDGESWQPLGEGLGGMYNGSAEAMTTYDGKLIVAGYFATAGGEPATSIAAWDTAPNAGPGDINCDGAVDGLDLLILLSAWGECDDPSNCPADLNGDGVVNGADLLLLLTNWG